MYRILLKKQLLIYFSVFFVYLRISSSSKSQFIIIRRQHMFDFFANHTVIEGDYRIEDIKVEQELGRGNAHVYTASIKGETYALKQIEIKTDSQYQNFLKQICNMQQISLKSEWIVKYHGYLVTKMERNQYDIKKYAYIIMQCAQENLQQFLNQHRDFKYRLKISQLALIVDQILTALASLEEINRAHCDVKPQNILVMNSKTFAIKLCDVGSSKVVSKQSLEQATILGTVPFLAPQLLKVQGSKTVGNRAFKSDVFSFGLVVLYLITHKKFKSQQRLQIDELTYRQVIGEWIKYAKQLCDDETSLNQIIKGALQFDQYRRPMFKDLKFVYFNERKKKSILNKSFAERLEKQQEIKLSRFQQTSTYFSSQPSNQINLFKTRRLQKINFTKTISNGMNFKIKTRNSPSPVKRTNSLASNSPQKTQKSVGLGSMHDLFSDMKKVIYIGEQTKHYLPESIEHQEQKNFVLGIPEFRFKKAQTITILPTCTYDVFENLQNVQCKRLYLQSMDKQMLGVPLDAPILKFSKIRINLNHSELIGGFDGLFRIITGQQLQLLELRLADTEVSTKEISYLLDRLISECPLLQTLLLSFQKKLITEQQHQMITQKIAKLPLKKLSLLMNECYIQYDKPARWALPKTIQTLYIDYGNNLLKNVVGNLSLSLSTSQNIKQISISLQNNALNKGDVHMLIKSVSSIKTLQRVTLNLAYNKIEQIKYLQSTLSLLKGINYLQVKLHKTEIQTEMILQLIEDLKEQLFVVHFNLKMMKITCNRNKSLHLMKERLNKICGLEGENKNKSLRCQVVGFDNLYYMIYIKKNDKLHSNRTKGGAAVKKSPKLQTFPKMATMSEGITLSNFNSAAKPSNICYQLYTSSDSFNNYLCLTCCQNKQMNKNMYYCKFCVSNCLTTCKDHYFVKVTQATRCVCAYSGQCKSDTKAVVCSDKMGAPLKKQYQCLRCETSYCMVCIQMCKDTHRDWVRERKELNYFKCPSKMPVKQ